MVALLANRVAAARGKRRRDRMRVHEQCQGGAQRQRRVCPVGLRRRYEHTHRSAGGIEAGHLRLRRGENMRPASDLRWQVDDGDEDDEVDEPILHEGDHRRSAQAGRVGICGEQCERDEQGQVLRDDAARTAEADHFEHRLDADELQCDVRHRGKDAGDRNRQGQFPGAITAPYEIRGGDVAVAVADRPQSGHVDENDRVQDDRVRNGKKTADRAEREHRRGHCHERVRRVEIAAEQKPRDPGAERASAKTPFVQACQVFSAPPVGRPETHDRDQQEQTDEHRQRGIVDAGIHRPASLPLRPTRRQRPARTSDEDEAVAGQGTGGAKEDPEKLVPDEERKARERRALSVRNCLPREALRSEPPARGRRPSAAPYWPEGPARHRHRFRRDPPELISLLATSSRQDFQVYDRLQVRKRCSGSEPPHAI